MAFDAIIILGGSMVKDGTIWRTTHFDEGDNFGSMGDYIRVIASYHLFRESSPHYLIASGGKGQFRDIKGAPTVASVIKRELLTLGIPEANIKEEDSSNNTYQQLKILLSMIRKNGWKKTGIISNRWHLPRVQAMIEYGPKDIADLGLLADLISAEETLLTYNPSKWAELIEEVYKSDKLNSRIALEEKGIRDIMEGKYIFK